MIYFDNSATTQTRVEVAQLVAKYSVEKFFNPSSIYNNAIEVKKDLDNARNTILKLLGANKNDKMIFTASATEANNMVLAGLSKKNKKILISSGEHPSIYEMVKNLMNNGYKIEFINLNENGTLDLDDLKQKLDDSVGLVSIIHISNETGAINDIAEIAKVVKENVPECLLHCDGVQAFGKVKLNLNRDKIDLYTISSHKIHGPKGVGGLYIKNGINIKPLILGGGQEGGLRSGTENPAGIMGFAYASELMYQDFENKRKHIASLKQYFIEGLRKLCIDFVLNSGEGTLDNICSVSFLGVRGEVLLHCLEKYEICVSTGSACSSKSIGNRVLSAMRQSNEIMLGNVRFSFSEFNTFDEIDKVLDALRKEIPLIKH